MAIRYLRDIAELEKDLFNDEGVLQVTSEQQKKVETTIKAIFHKFFSLSLIDKGQPRLIRAIHIEHIKRSLNYLSIGYSVLDASRTWLCYWGLHSLSLLGYELKNYETEKITTFLEKCQHPNGGFGGGPGQYPHIATTYAAVNALCVIGTQRAYDTINRKSLKKFLWNIKTPEGAFCMHVNGEVDIRGVYCALAVATLTNIACDELFRGTSEWVISCQTYEGGFSGCPGMEAHGGYTYCGLASLVLLRKTHLCDFQSLLRWMVNRQMRYEGGFQGRTNKLVDGCYSFWQGGAIALISQLIAKEDPTLDTLLFDQGALQEYILICCQYKNGGLIDKPGRPTDLYHTCYVLSGLSISQRLFNGGVFSISSPEINLLGETHLLYNINPRQALKAVSHFTSIDAVGDSTSGI